LPIRVREKETESDGAQVERRRYVKELLDCAFNIKVEDHDLDKT